MVSLNLIEPKCFSYLILFYLNIAVNFSHTLFYNGALLKHQRRPMSFLKLFMCQLLSGPAKIIDAPLYGDQPRNSTLGPTYTCTEYFTASGDSGAINASTEDPVAIDH